MARGRVIIRRRRLFQIFRSKGSIIRVRRLNRGTAIIRGNTVYAILRCYNHSYFSHFVCFRCALSLCYILWGQNESKVVRKPDDNNPRHIITWIWLLVSQMPTEGLLLHFWDPRTDHSQHCADAHSFRGTLVRNCSGRVACSGQDKDSPLTSGFCNPSLNIALHFSSDVWHLSLLLLADLNNKCRKQDARS